MHTHTHTHISKREKEMEPNAESGYLCIVGYNLNKHLKIFKSHDSRIFNVHFFFQNAL